MTEEQTAAVLEFDEHPGSRFAQSSPSLLRGLSPAAYRQPYARPGDARASRSQGSYGRQLAQSPDNVWINVALTYQGLKALGVPQASLDSFSPEFQQGMAARAEK